MLKVAEKAELLIVDECYMHFADESIASTVGEMPVIILKTISKLGSAALQLGYILGRKELLERIDLKSEPSLSGVMAAIALFSDEGREETRRIVEMINAERDRMTKALSDLGYNVIPSKANFLLVNQKCNEAERLKDIGICVKSVEFHGEPYMRITVRADWENDLLLLALRELNP